MELDVLPAEVPVPDATGFLADLEFAFEPAAVPALDDGLLPPSQALAGECGQGDAAPAALPDARAAAHAGQGVLIGGLRLFLRFDQSSEISEMGPVYRLPGTPAWVRGVANLHGNLLPVVDLAGFFGLAEAGPGRPMLLVLGHGEAAVATIISGAPQRLRFAEEERVPAPLVGERLQPYVPGAFARGADIWLEFEHEQLLEALATALASGRATY
ncbi:MAG: chemotaxis protein CheW [Ignavibacteria bacterium]